MTEDRSAMHSPEASVPSKKDSLFSRLRRNQRNLFVAGVAATAFGLEAHHSASAQKDAQSTRSSQVPVVEIPGSTNDGGFERYGLKLGNNPEKQQIPVEFPIGSLYATANPQEGYERINIRQSQSIDSAIATTINRGERLVVHLPENGVPGWYEAYDTEGTLLGFVHSSVLQLEQSPTPPTPLPIQPSPVPEAVQPGNETGTNTTTEENQAGSEATGIPEIIAPTAAPVLTPLPTEETLNSFTDPEYAERFYSDLREAQRATLEAMDLEPIPASQVSWITNHGETLPMGLVDYIPYEGFDGGEHYFAFAGVFRGARQYEFENETNTLFVVDVNNNRFVIDLTEYYGDGEQLGFYLAPRGGDLQDAQYQQITRFEFHDFLLNATPNQEIVLFAYPSAYVPDNPTRAENEIRQLSLVEESLRSNTPITNSEVGFDNIGTSSIQGFIFQENRPDSQP